MTRKWIAIVSVSVLAAACGGAPSNPTHTALDTKVEAKKPKVKKAKAEVKEEAPAAMSQVGDFAVHRFSGSFRKTPIVLTEEVVAKADGKLVIDYTFEEGDSKIRLRTWNEIDSGLVVKVAKLEGENEVEMGIDAFDALIAETIFSADANEKILAKEESTCLVGTREVDCEQTRYQVRVGDAAATLSVTRSKSLLGHDLSGEIISEKGEVIYRAELLEAGNEQSSTSVASRH